MNTTQRDLKQTGMCKFLGVLTAFIALVFAEIPSEYYLPPYHRHLWDNKHTNLYLPPYISPTITYPTSIDRDPQPHTTRRQPPTPSTVYFPPPTSPTITYTPSTIHTYCYPNPPITHGQPPTPSTVHIPTYTTPHTTYTSHPHIDIPAPTHIPDPPPTPSVPIVTTHHGGYHYNPPSIPFELSDRRYSYVSAETPFVNFFNDQQPKQSLQFRRQIADYDGVSNKYVDPDYQNTYDIYAPKYQHKYDVFAPEYGVNFSHQEGRQDDVVKGEYHVLLPDGRIQHVEYTADQDGYHPTITYEGGSI